MASGFDLNFTWVFDPGDLLKAEEEMERRVLTEFGKRVKKIARDSIHEAPGGVAGQMGRYVRTQFGGQDAGAVYAALGVASVSRPYEPPYTHRETGQKYKNSIDFNYSHSQREVVIGGELLKSSGGDIVPEKIEYGGDETVTVPDITLFRGKRPTVGWKRVRAHYEPRPAMRLAFNRVINEMLPELVANSILKAARKTEIINE